MAVVFAQGMRRSGTTILYDVLFGDPRIRCWYEPLNQARPAPGGGSRARKVDHLAPVLAFREQFLAARDDGLTQDDLNWGAPTAPERELEGDWPSHVRDLLGALAASDEHVFVKLTRAPGHVAELAAIQPEAHFLHLVRDPRAVAQSHIFRRLPETRERILAGGTFFTLTTDFDQWRAETMANHLIATRGDLAHLADEPAYVKVLLLWRELYTRTRDAAARAFPGRHALVWHDALCADPLPVITSVYERFGLRVPLRVRRWAKRNIRPAKPWHAPDAPEWRRAFELLGLDALVAECERYAL